MAQSMMNKERRGMVGEYEVGNQIGFGSFSTVWLARHRVSGAEVAIKEIVMERLDNKLKESLKSEIVILRNINHPNIIRLHDMIEESGKIYIVLEYCKGGDLSVYLRNRQGKIPEANAKHFMQQLASGLKILHNNRLIHRDLKPQNLLLSTNDDSSILKIADFGFARSLQMGLAETLCGSPLYMAPEIMQSHKYDAKADLWSVGAILFQLVTGKTPFTGNSHLQLLQNIERSTGLKFPPDSKNLSPECIDLCRKLLRLNPVERITFEEFFNHPFLSQRQPEETLRNMRSQRVIDGFPISESDHVRNLDKSSQEDCLPSSLRDDTGGLDGRPSLRTTSSLKTTYGFSPNAEDDRKEIFSTSKNPGLASKFNSARHKPEAIDLLSGKNLKEPLKSVDYRLVNSRPKAEADSWVLVDQDYVLVARPPLDSFSSASASKLSCFPSKMGSPSLPSVNIKSTSSTPAPIISLATREVGSDGNFESHNVAPRTSLASMDVSDTLERASTVCTTRIKSLKCFASAITELVNKKTEGKRHLEAFSVQLVILAIWKQALDISHTQAASAIDMLGSVGICSEIERALLVEVGNAEELAKALKPETTEMPDAMEIIYEAALDQGKDGAVKEYFGDIESAEVLYSKAVRLLVFLLLEAPSLLINPPFSLTNSDRLRIQNYIDHLSNRQSISGLQRLALLNSRDQQCPP